MRTRLGNVIIRVAIWVVAIFLSLAFWVLGVAASSYLAFLVVPFWGFMTAWCLNGLLPSARLGDDRRLLMRLGRRPRHYSLERWIIPSAAQRTTEAATISREIYA
jgi:uncharacterized protein (DUF58 family)